MLCICRIWSVMNGPKPRKLKWLLERVPPGFLVDSKWLAHNGIAKSSVHDYGRAGWLEHVARGLYRRPYAASESYDQQDWALPILSAQWIMRYDFHVGAVTALALQGHQHYLPLGGKAPVYLYGDVPAWLPRLPLDATVHVRRRQLFGASQSGVENIDFDPLAHEGGSLWRWPLKTSSSERAVLEAINELPDQEGFETIDKLFEGLTSLRPRRLTALLGECRSIKVKRLFFLFADRHRHAWLRHIDKGAINLGSGPRMLVEGGKLNATYQIVVPAEFSHLNGTNDGA